MYVLPAEETGDDSYEPPPAEQEKRTMHPALPFARGEYIGKAAPQTLGAQPARQGKGDKAGRQDGGHLTLSPPPHWSSGHSETTCLKWKMAMLKTGKR